MLEVVIYNNSYIFTNSKIWLVDFEAFNCFFLLHSQTLC